MFVLRHHLTPGWLLLAGPVLLLALVVTQGCLRKPKIQAAETDPWILASLSGTVARVTDGDTITILASNQELQVKLYGMMAPSYTQPYGKKSKQALADMVLGHPIQVDIVGTDSYGRTVGLVYRDEQFVNLAMIRYGWAWCYQNFVDLPGMREAEGEARTQRAGLWQGSNPVPPWKFRTEAEGTQR